MGKRTAAPAGSPESSSKKAKVEEGGSAGGSSGKFVARSVDEAQTKHATWLLLHFLPEVFESTVGVKSKHKCCFLAVTPASDVVVVEFWEADCDKVKKIKPEGTTRVVDVREAFISGLNPQFDGVFDRRGASTKIKLCGPTRRIGNMKMAQTPGRIDVFFKLPAVSPEKLAAD